MENLSGRDLIGKNWDQYSLSIEFNGFGFHRIIEIHNRLRARLESARELLRWIAHLHHGCSKGGPEFEPPSDREWTDCLSKITSWLAEDGEE